MKGGAALVVLGVVSFGCSSAAKDPPPPTSYSLAFPSTDVALATETVEVLVFDVPPEKRDLCNSLVVKRKSNQDLGAPIVTSTPKGVCDLSAGQGNVQVPFGLRAFLAIGQQHQKDFVIGCTTQQVAGGTPPPSIFLEYVSDTVPPAPPTKCQSVSQKCQGGC